MKVFLKNAALLLIILLYTTISFSQKSQIAKANKEFDKYSYIDAREIYLKVIEDGYTSAEIYERLGDTYYFNSEYKNASKWYSKLVAEFPDEVKTEYYYRASQSLKSVGSYKKSDTMMILYSERGGDELIAENFKNNPNYLESITDEARDFQINKVTVNSAFSDFGPSFYLNKVVFASNSKESEGVKTLSWNGLPYLDLYEADMDENGNLSNVTLLNGDVNTKYNESSSAFTKDGKTLYFTRNNYFEGKKGRDKNKTIRLKLYKATKSGDTFWGNIEELPFNGKEFSVAHPTLSTDEKRLYFSSDMEGTLGQSDIWYVDVLENNAYGTPVNLGTEINTEARETFPFISDKNKLYFSTDGRAGLGGLDVYVASLNDQGGVTGKITNLGEPANSSSDDFGFIINEEKRIGYVSSNRGGDKGSVEDDIYLINERCVITVSGLVTDIKTGSLIPGAEVLLLDTNNKLVSSMAVGSNARYNFTTDCETVYTLRGIKAEYEPTEKRITTPTETGSIDVPLKLNPLDCPPNDLGCRLTLLPIYFDFDRFNIRKDASIELAKILAAMREYKELIIHIESHTDARGDDLYNEILSEKRAQSTLNWLVDQGIDRSRLSAKGYGEKQHVNGCSNGVKCTEEEHQLNRRSMFIIQN
ncbi:MAG: OmpA family protein [Flavobacteriaceae bacterium]|nr:OmpA family protein [Flavobacteriaceae bacterium]